MSKSNGAIAREELAALMRRYRENVLHVSRSKIGVLAGVSRKALNRLEHASPRQNRWEIIPVIESYGKMSPQEKRLAYHLLDIAFPGADVIPESVPAIPRHLLPLIRKHNRRRIRYAPTWPRRFHKSRRHLAR